MEVAFLDDRVHPVTKDVPDADLYALSFFPPAATRGMEIADMLREMGKRVVAGGMFPTLMPDEVQEHCDAVVVGEGELVWPQVCYDAAAGQLKPRYQAKDWADLSKLPVPRIDLYLDAEDGLFSPYDYPLQLSRGCPLNCYSCSLPACMGRSLRFFPEETVLETLKQFVSSGKRCCLAEDTAFFLVPRFRAFLKKAAEWRKTQPVRFHYVGTSPLMLSKTEDKVLDELREAGFERLYVVCGFDPITRAAFGRGDPESMAQAEEAIQRCHDHGVEPYPSFTVGNEDEDEGVFDRVLEFADRTQLNIAEFTIATPYPGTPMWDKMVTEERILDYTWKRYNDAHVVFQPSTMSVEQLQAGYLYMWKEFYRTRQYVKDIEALSTVQL
jgi:radical SAM superfamily enzyme YgiQ (UPF0313 family)